MIVAEALSAMRSFRSDHLRRALDEGVVRFGHNGVLHRVIHPLAREVGELWQTGAITAAHEHFASALIRDFLLGAARPFALGEGAPRAVVGTPAGQLHELGAVMVAAAATNVGWRTIYLGPSLPAAEIAGAAIQNRARVVLLSLVYPTDDPQMAGELTQLRRYLPAEVAIVAGGRAAAAYSAALTGIQALTPSSLDELTDLLEELRGVRSE
jgi:methanogenic corrinoid protein MtbC1